jgi:Na+/citrate or Na+/malate symporter
MSDEAQLAHVALAKAAYEAALKEAEIEKPKPQVDPNLIHRKIAALEVYKILAMNKKVYVGSICSYLLIMILSIFHIYAGMASAFVASLIIAFLLMLDMKHMQYLNTKYEIEQRGISNDKYKI